jgi:tetratricopeptide (TPR) repeat protein
MTLPTLCLNMIVKNESLIITRLLDSVLPIIDCYCICDTGSTDNTIEVIQNYFNDKNITGRIVQEPFLNFSYNRNIALQYCLGMSDYVLLVDADMCLQINNFSKSMLRLADCFHLLQGNNNFQYKNVRIIKNSGLFQYNGVTHEHIQWPSNTTIHYFSKDFLFLHDFADGGCKHNKFQRDIQLLQQGLLDEPNNERYQFYLANSYFDIDQFNEAIPQYLERIKMGGWKEEIWYSYYRLGLCHANIKNMKDALWYWMEAYNYNPERIESLYQIILNYRLEGKNKAAFAIYKICKEELDKKRNLDHCLFLHKDIYDYKLDFEYTIIAAYNGITNINNEVIKILNSTTLQCTVSNLLRNMKFYPFVLQCTNLTIFDEVLENGFVSSSSSLCPTLYNKGNYIMNIRYVNYHIFENGKYKTDKQIISLNKFVILNKNMEKIQTYDIPNEESSRLYVGIEDIRIFPFQDNYFYIGTTFHETNTMGMNFGRYPAKWDELMFYKQGKDIYQHFDKSSQCEKNWALINWKNEIHIIYKWHPLTICKLNNDCIEILERRNTPQLFSLLRGSTCGYLYDNEYWFVTHIVSHENPRHYYHVIVVLDSNLNVSRYSAPFKFSGKPIEYCLSIVIENDKVLMNYSEWDRSTRIGSYDKKYIDSLLTFN